MGKEIRKSDISKLTLMDVFCGNYMPLFKKKKKKTRSLKTRTASYWSTLENGKNLQKSWGGCWTFLTYIEWGLELVYLDIQGKCDMIEIRTRRTKHILF